MTDNVSIKKIAEDNQVQFLVFRLDEQGYALCLSMIEKVVRATAITPLPKAPGTVMGMINWEGRILPVVNIRACFRLAPREINLTDLFIFSRTARRWMALPADSVDGVLIRSRDDVITPDKILPGLDYVEGVVKLEDGLLLIHDPDKLLSLEEIADLDDALGASKNLTPKCME